MYLLFRTKTELENFLKEYSDSVLYTQCKREIGTRETSTPENSGWGLAIDFKNEIARNNFWKEHVENIFNPRGKTKNNRIIMNKTILSEFSRAKNIYPVILGILLKYAKNQKYDNLGPSNILLKKLKKITGKNTNVIDSYFESQDAVLCIEDIEDLSFKISLPEPKIIKNITQEEMAEIVKIVKDEDYRNYTTDYIVYRFFIQFNDYFQKLLEINLQYLLQNCVKNNFSTLSLYDRVSIE